jgi:type IV secretory pathway VirJ component
MKGLVMLAAILFSTAVEAQDISTLPVVPYPAKANDAQKTLVLYLSGDGGENTFSKSLVQQIQDKGYSVVFFNSLKYFWTKKTPEQTSADVEKVIRYYHNLWKTPQLIVIGYSFGADVAPFVVNRISRDIFNSIKNIVLLSPSPTTDFEVHVADLFGKGKKQGSSVVAEINKITQKPFLILHGSDETDKIEPASLKVPYKFVTIKGGHKFDSNTAEVASNIFKNL